MTSPSPESAGSKEGQEYWKAFPTTPGMGTSGWAFIRQLEGAHNFHGYVFGMSSYDGPNGPALLLAEHLNALESALSARDARIGELEAKFAALDEILSGRDWKEAITEFLKAKLADEAYEFVQNVVEGDTLSGGGVYMARARDWVRRYTALLSSPSTGEKTAEGCPGWSHCNKGACQVSGECKFREQPASTEGEA